MWAESRFARETNLVRLACLGPNSNLRRLFVLAEVLAAEQARLLATDGSEQDRALGLGVGSGDRLGDLPSRPPSLTDRKHRFKQ